MDLFKPNKEFDDARIKANEKILEIISKYLDKNPSIRFGQALLHLDIIKEDENFASIEPMSVLERIHKTDTYKRLMSED